MTDSEKPTADRDEFAEALAHQLHRRLGPGTLTHYRWLAGTIVDDILASGVIQPANLHAAKVLREAAAECSVNDSEGLRVHAWLRARADRIEGGES